MVTIARHHANDPYRPQCGWTDQTYVQWGRGGLVLTDNGKRHYTTAFFEAFPKDNASDFIRGEGQDLAEAERNAFAKWQREVNCQHSHWQRRGYRNSLGFCARCGAGKSVFSPIFKIGQYRQPIDKFADYFLEDDDDDRSDKFLNRLRIQKRLYGVKGAGEAEGIVGFFEKVVDRST